MKEEQFEQEKRLVRNLRYNKRLSYKEISEKLNRSIYWVHCRLSEKYEPKRSRIEKQFQDTVINFLKNKGWKIIKGETRSECKEFSQEVDIKAEKEGVSHIIEIKNIVNHHQLQTAIGQIILHQYVLKNKSNIKYQIVFPKKYKNYRYFSKEFLEYLDRNHGIKIWFM